MFKGGSNPGIRECAPPAGKNLTFKGGSIGAQGGGKKKKQQLAGLQRVRVIKRLKRGNIVTNNGVPRGTSA